MPPSYKIKFSDRALLEIAESWDCYEEQQYGVGDKFRAAVVSATEVLKKQPYQYAIRFSDYREIQLKKFPFILIYQIKEAENLIEITSIFHTKRNPQNKYRP